jgi:hypothetical protein
MHLRAPMPAEQVHWDGARDDRPQRRRKGNNPGAPNLFLQLFSHGASHAVSVQGLRAREQTGQSEERRSFNEAGRNTMPRESKRFSGTTVLLSVDSCILRTIGK